MSGAARVMRTALALTLSLGAAGCAGQLRFADQPTVWAVDDKRDIPEPEEREFLKYQYFVDIIFLRRSVRALQLHDLEPAHNTNALEEVPDSTWFQNRIGLFDLTAEQVARGPADLPGPKPPFTVIRGKTGGGNLGFVIKDAVGRKFLFKFDRPENPEMQTGSNVVVNRLVWAFGYHVPRDYVLFVRRAEIVIPKEATAKDVKGNVVPFTEETLLKTLQSAPPPKDSAYRATASELLEGKAIGGWANEGVRSDDANDTIPHEHRREVRGLRVLSAWINHTDMKEDNTLDTYVQEGGKRFVRHHLIDFGEALGGHAGEKNRPEDAYEHYWDWEKQGEAFLAVGLWKRPWESLERSPYKSLGWFSDQSFHPEDWREAYPYWPFWEMDRADAFWGAKIVMRFRREHIEAAVREGLFSEQGAPEYLTRVLENRRDAIGRVWLEGLTALDRFELRGGMLCATDLGLTYRLATASVVERLDDGDVVDRVKPDASARACVRIGSEADYRVIHLRIRRGTVAKPPLEVHVIGDRIVGLVRDPR